MIIKLNRKPFGLIYEYKFIHKDNSICNSYIKHTTTGRIIYLVKNKIIEYKIESCLGDELKKTFDKHNVYKSYLIKDSTDKICGYIAYKESSFWFGYYYYEIMINGRVSTIYEVGKGKEALFLTMYQDKEQVALISKNTMVNDKKYTYINYLKTERDMTSVMLINVLYDDITSENKHQYGYKGKENNYVNTTNKFVKSTYNPDFIKGIEE